jgi:rhodanese-related sulfurtransferase
MHPLPAPGLAAWLADTARPAPQLLEVREPWEVATASLPGAIAIPMGQIAARAGELDPSRPVVCLCHHGMRSLQVVRFLLEQGFSEVVNLQGGIDAWSTDLDPSVPRY